MATDSIDRFIGRWEVTSTENMTNMLQAFDMDDDKRQMYSEMKFKMEYSRDGDQWIYVVSMADGSSKTTQFQVGKQFDSTTFDGRPIVSLITVEDGKFVEMHTDKADPTLSARMIREIVDGELLVSATVRDVTSITRHKRL